MFVVDLDMSRRRGGLTSYIKHQYNNALKLLNCIILLVLK
jgi:hypothetical protein